MVQYQPSNKRGAMVEARLGANGRGLPKFRMKWDDLSKTTSLPRRALNGT
jgi:hypothetical protein